jgi:hypothetical protein
LASAVSHLAQRRFDAARHELDTAASICPGDDPQWARIDELRNVYLFLQFGSSAGKGQSIPYSDMEHMRGYWASVLRPSLGSADLPENQLRKARALYYLSRLRYFEWHAAREHWTSVTTSPALGRSTSYEDRRSKHFERCEKFQGKVKAYNEAALAAIQAPLSVDATNLAALIGQERQLRIEYVSLQQLGSRLLEEHEAESISQAQLVGRAVRDLSQLLQEAASLAERSSESMAKLAAGTNDNYDPSLHYLALTNQAEILYARLATMDESNDIQDTNAYRQLFTHAIDALEAAVGLMADAPLVKLGSFADPCRFIADFDKGTSPSTDLSVSNVPTAVLLTRLVDLSQKNAPDESIERLTLLIDKHKQLFGRLRTDGHR